MNLGFYGYDPDDEDGEMTEEDLEDVAGGGAPPPGQP